MSFGGGGKKLPIYCFGHTVILVASSIVKFDGQS